MHAHDQKPGTTRVPHDDHAVPLETSEPAADLSPEGVLRLQRAVGNAAVTRLITAQRRVAVRSRDDAGSHESVHDVLSSHGKPLAPPLRAEMEQRIGSDFSDVRLHDDTTAQRSATALGARAYTSGHHIVTATPDIDKHTLAHELIHVVQQRRGPVAGADNGHGVRVSDPGDRFERAAEAGATRVMAAHHPGDGHDHGSDGAAHPTATGGAVQRTVTLHLGGAAAELDLGQAVAAEGLDAADPDALFGFVVRRLNAEAGSEQALTQPEQEAFTRHQQAVKAQLHKWVAATPRARGPKSHDVFGAKQQDRHYNNYSDLARGLVGWVEAKPARRREGELADAVKDDSEVELQLEVLLARIRGWVEGQPGFKWGLIEYELANSGFGHYQKYFDHEVQKVDAIPAADRALLRTGINGDMWQVMGEPQNYSFRDKVVVLHDLMEYFGRRQWWNPPTEGNDTIVDQPGQDLTTTAVDAAGNRIAADGDRGQERFQDATGRIRNAPSTRRESAESTRLARRHAIPVWAGTSFTAMRMLNLAQHVRGSLEEISAVAWGVFAFWRLDYDHGVDLAYHTLHEVMDIAQNFGIPYNVLNREQDLDRHAPGSARQRLTTDSNRADAELGQAEVRVDQMTRWLNDNPLSDPAVHAQAMAELSGLAGRIADLRRRLVEVRDGIARIPDQLGPDDRALVRRLLLGLPGLVGQVTTLYGEVTGLTHPEDVQAALTLRDIGAAVG
jgi:hypothetical protein